ncbi:hypothetical protein KSF_088050 [Reticulibacter mediterranei]|uniref:Uncharacterized protein n=1 Tax=Reticulibacter mediterranei TaxID=2778369 RepID=A0A8J3IXT6_9CHLR|nr:hypothetical protein [Reticulibacter mediterranei]GHO98757.1 hypothetical protein KSF_088050 [Reticulibacter mediterranei]
MGRFIREGYSLAKSKRRTNGEGRVTRRKDGCWAASFYDAERKRCFVYETLEKLRKAQREYEQGMLVDGSKVKLGAFLDQWLDEIQ